jgi:hypothetical protein
MSKTLTILFLATAVACGSSSSNPNANASVKLMISDASNEDFSLIGVKVLAIALVPQGGGAPVTVFTAPNPPPEINLVQLDQLGEILGNVSLPPGTYTSATVTIAANPGDVELHTSTDPQPGFAGAANTEIASSDIQIQGASGAAGSKTVTVPVNLSAPLTVTAGENGALDLEFDLGHPAFIIDHVAVGGAVTWAVNFKGVVHHHPLRRLSHFVLRQVYGALDAVAADNLSFTMTKVYPVHPAVNPETAVASSQMLEIKADTTNGTIVYDLDAKTRSTVKDFSSIAANAASKFVRVAARFQDDGSLYAVRVWMSASFNSVWVSPEGHVLHVGASSLTVENEDAMPVPLTVDAGTQFFFRSPAGDLNASNAIGAGPGFLANLKRGFKVHASVVDPLANPLVAQNVDIEIARFDGDISAVSSSGFTYTRSFRTASDDYTVALPYISAQTDNGDDASGNQVLGFKWWDLAYPTLAETGSLAVGDYVSATNGSVSFGGTAKAIPVWGESYALWNDPAAANGWSAAFTILVPQPAPLAAVAAPFAAGTSSGSFSITVAGAAHPVTVDVSGATGSATLVYQVDKTGSVVTVSAIDPTTSAGVSAMTTNLTAGASAKVFGVPQPDGSIRADVLFYYTGTMPLQ